MARPIKQGLDYFPLDTKFDDKVEICIATFNSTHPNASRAIVIGVLIELYQAIYFDSFYTLWNDDRSLLYACKLGLNFDDFTFILNTALTKGIFDKSMFEKHGILTSEGIQKRYFEAVGRRKNIDIKNEYLLINIPIKEVNVYNNSINVDNNSINVCNNATNKIKENKSKVKESKLNENNKSGKPTKHAYGEFENVLLNEKEYQKLIDKHGKSVVDDYIEKVSGYCKASGKKYKDYYATVQNWLRKDKPSTKKSTSYLIDDIKKKMNNFD